ncbi:MAG: hypothetical protein II603_11015 [Muribaculaceae bacterium]|nr:hypothetical protein [Muribaculaceae bacterium]
MSTANIIRFGLVGALWLALCYLLVSRMREVTLVNLFPIIASGIIISCPCTRNILKKTNDRNA